MARDGYAWWYVDAFSDDGRHGITLIAFVGSVFSPYYAWSRRRGRGDPLDHCALNVALYGDRGKRWTMTERRRAGIERRPDSFVIGPSNLAWDGDALTIRIEEIGAPIPRRIRGHVRVSPSALTTQTFTLDDAGRHRWRPLAPCARIEVALEDPALQWSGDGYLDMNEGDAPLEDDFVSWQWSRAKLSRGTAILYDAVRRRGGDQLRALMVDSSGGIEPFDAGSYRTLPRTRWRMARSTRADADATTITARTLEDAPFYARSLLTTRLFGDDCVAMHESLSLDRFRMPVVQAMLPFRMPRALW